MTDKQNFQKLIVINLKNIYSKLNNIVGYISYIKKNNINIFKTVDIGSKNKNSLLRHFGGIESLRKASLDQIKSIEGIGPMKAKLIFDYLNKK